MTTNDIQKTIEFFSTTGGLIEIRALNCWDNSPDYQSTRSGYFDAEHLAEAEQAALTLEGAYHAGGVYVTLNPAKPELLARSANRVKKAQKGETTKDDEIASRRWMLIDFDPKRPKGVSSTDEELLTAETEARRVLEELSNNGFPSPVVAMSGNGWHLLYRIDLETNDKTVESCLKALATKSPLVDSSNFNAARITKLYGTIARKGDHTADRPHRQSRLVEVPEFIDPVSIDCLNWLAGLITQRTPETYHSSNSDSIDVGLYLRNRGVDVLNQDTWSGSQRWFIRCPGIESHSTTNADSDCSIWQDGSGMVAAKCFHDSCGMKSWSDIRDFLGMVKPSDFRQVDTGPVPMVDPLGESPSKILAVNSTIEDDEEASDEGPEQIELDFPSECLRPPGLIGDFIDYTLSTAKYPQPEHTLAAGLCLMSLATGRRVADSDGTRGNLMVVGLGPTRSGKEYPRAVVKTILEAVGAVTWFEEKLASEASLYGFLKMSHAGLLINDEFGDWLALARSKAGPNTQQARILTAMTMLYSSANGRFKAPRYAENSKQVELNQPHLVFMGTSTAEVFWKHVTPEYLSGGLFGRVMLFENRGYVDPMPRAGRNRQLPESLLNEIKEWMKFSAVAGDLAWENPTPFIVPHSSDALERFECHELDISKKRKRKSESAIKAALWSGTAEFTAKLALLFACSRSRNPLMITIEDVELAIKLSNWLTRRKVILCDDHVAENAVEDASKRVYRIIKSAGSSGIGLTGLTHKTRWLSRRDRTEIITDLMLSGNIAETEIGTRTKTKRVYMAKVNAGIVAGSLKMDV